MACDRFSEAYQVLLVFPTQAVSRVPRICDTSKLNNYLCLDANYAYRRLRGKRRLHDLLECTQLRNVISAG